ncbi:hypothetical protein CFHF_05595 [Caulobacter flavus]|uniref:Uncharacterized protein n=1 Tax=Caulobacter flavus TaxID=1679497 RepID=A0A2N5CWQ5_9CAUL|nr:hypothetical protein [Caulobacter flavus]AYV47391.1 hypothetical protein C1707_14600 [Caulobacter flavus]PLR18234.1 hypothetical protein CFHF_05595 [Caulobacter flavus]
MYQSEFPVETPVPIFDPTLLAGIALITLAVAALAFFAGRFTGGKGRDERWRDVPKTIHKAILARCVAATSAPTGELLRRAEELVAEVEARVGALIAFAACGKALKSLEKACQGQFPKPEVKPEPKAPKSCTCGHQAKGEGGHDHGKPAEAHPGTCKAPAPCQCVVCCVPVTVGGLALAAPQVKISSRQTVIVNAPAAPAAPALAPHACTCGASVHGKPHEDEAHDKPEPPLEWSEHMRRLRLAVVEFADVWNSPDNLRLLERCQKQLIHTGPAPKTGHQHGEERGGH